MTFKVIQEYLVFIGTNRSRVCDFVLVLNSRITLVLSCPVLHILEHFVRQKTAFIPHPLFRPKFRGCYRSVTLRSAKSTKPTLIIHDIIFEVLEPVRRPRYLNDTDRRTH